MRIYDIIDKKRHGLKLTKDEINFVISSYMKNEVADYQMSALLMAICINSMDEEETANLTGAMINSGEILDLNMLKNTVDKHSTGGIGDKTTLIVAPIVASLGCTVAKMSGRGLGFTGGTIDKLESISGLKTELTPNEFINQAKKHNIVVVGQSANLAPADKKLYALRDVTATVESIPLIASSIMSKKIASGAKSIVLDVKVGSGAFMKDLESARALARAMIKIGNSFERNVTCILSDMSVPLGLAVGNSVEIWEAIEVLSGQGESRLCELCITVSSSMVSSALGISHSDAKAMVIDSIKRGLALDKFHEWIEKQGGDASKIKDRSLLLSAKYKKQIISKKSGYICNLDAEKIGVASMSLGAGRVKKSDPIDHLAGIILSKTYGDFIKEGDVLATMYSSNEELFDSAIEIFNDAISITCEKPAKKDLIYEIIK